MSTQAISTLIQECSKGRMEGLHTDAEHELVALRRAARALMSINHATREYVSGDPAVAKAFALIAKVAAETP